MTHDRHHDGGEIKVNSLLPSAFCFRVCICVHRPSVCSFYLTELPGPAVLLTFTRDRRGVMKAELWFVSYCGVKLAEEGGMVCRKLQEGSQV